MRTTVLDADRYSKMTTDGPRFGCDSAVVGGRAQQGLAELTTDLTTAVAAAYWSFMLQAELEDAFDTALMRAAFADTPTYSGTVLLWTV